MRIPHMRNVVLEIMISEKKVFTSCWNGKSSNFSIEKSDPKKRSPLCMWTDNVPCKLTLAYLAALSIMASISLLALWYSKFGHPRNKPVGL